MKSMRLKAERIAAGRLNLDHLGSVVGQDQGADCTRHAL